MFLKKSKKDLKRRPRKRNNIDLNREVLCQARKKQKQQKLA